MTTASKTSALTRSAIVVGVLAAVLAPMPDAARAGTDSPCLAAAPKPVTHVVVIVMENKDESSVIGSSQAPYLNQLGAECAIAIDYHAVAHPSLPNYLALTGGSTFGVTDDKPPASHRIGAASIFGQLNGDWRAYQESMTVSCQKYGQGSYAPKHNPAAYFTAVPECASRDVPLPATPSFDAAFTFVTPNLIDDMHNGTIAQGDRWMSAFVPKVLDSPQYQAGSLALFIVWDENDGPHHAAGNQVACFTIAPFIARGTTLKAGYTHYSLLATWEDLLGLPRLGKATSATSMMFALRSAGGAARQP